MKNVFTLLLALILGVFLSSPLSGQTCTTNINSLDQYPILSLSLAPGTTGPAYSIYSCKGKLVVEFYLNNNTFGGPNPPSWFDADITITGSGSSGNCNVNGATMFIKPGSLVSPGYPIYMYEIDLYGCVDLETATSIDVDVKLTSMDLTNGVNTNWDWAYDDASNCGIMYMGSNMVDMSTPVYYASDDESIAVNILSTTPQEITAVNVTSVTPQTIPGVGTLCSETDVVGDFELYQLTGVPSTAGYFYSVNVYETVGSLVNTYVYDGVPALAVVCSTCTSGYKIPFQFTFPMAINATYEFKITNVSVRQGILLPSNLITGFDCWLWTVPSGYEYGPHSPNHTFTPISIGTKSVPSGCSPASLFSGALTFEFKNSTNLGTSTSPIPICDLNSQLKIQKSVDASTCYLTFKYRLELIEYNSTYTTQIGSTSNMTDIFSNNTASWVNGTLNNSLNSGSMWSGVLSGFTTERFFRVRLYGYKTGCPDVAEQLFKELFFVFAPSPATQPKIELYVNQHGGITNSTIANVCCQTAVLINAGNFSNVVSLWSDLPLYTSTIRGRLLKMDTFGCPDTSANGVLWSSMLNSGCFSPKKVPYGSHLINQDFASFGGSNIGWTPPGAPGGCTGINSHTDLRDYIYGRTAFPSLCNGSGEFTPEQIGMDRAYFNRVGNEARVYLEAWTVDDCTGESERAYLKLKILEPTHSSMTINTPTGCGLPNLVIPAVTHEPIVINISNTSQYATDLNELVSTSTGVKDFGSTSGFGTSGYNPGYQTNCPSPCTLDPNFHNSEIYDMGANTGFIEIMADAGAGTEINVDDCILKLAKIRYDVSSASNGWQYIFNEDGNSINFLNTVTSRTGRRISNVRLPINNPYGPYATGYNLWGPSNSSLFANGGAIDMFKTGGAATDDMIYRIEMDVVNMTNAIPRINATYVNNFAIAYFRFVNLLTRSAPNQYDRVQQIPVTGIADFWISNRQLMSEISLPEGGILGFDLYDISGKKLYSQSEKKYPKGISKESVSILNSNSGIYILRYVLNGEIRSLKLGSIY